MPSAVHALAQNVGSAPSPYRSGIFPAAEEIGQQIQELVTGDANAEIEPQETFGTRALGLIISTAKLVTDETKNIVDNFAAYPQLMSWFNQQVTNPTTASQWVDTLQLMILAVGFAYAAGWLLDLILYPLRRRLARRASTLSYTSKFIALFGRFLLSLIPLALFLGVALVIVDQSNPTRLSRYLVLTVIYAMALLRVIRAILKFIFAPKAEALRLVPITTNSAIYLTSWMTWYSTIAVMGYFVAEMAKVVKVPAASISGFRDIVAFVIIAMTIVVIVQKRAFVSNFLRGNLSAAQPHGLMESLRLWLARSWHVLAISYLIIGYFVTMLGSSGGFLAMQQGTIGTILALLAMRLVFYMSSRLIYTKRSGQVNANIYRPVLRFFIRMATWALGIAGIAASWGVDVQAVIASPWGQRILGSAFSISATILLLVIVYEFIHAFIERKLNKRDGQGNIIQADARSLTLLPMIRNAAIFILGLIATMVTLSELGVDTTPLLAGAGVLGVALGFGSQTLVKDFLTGLFIIVENTIAVGDIVKLGEHGGTVEGMTLRTVRLRDMQGALHIVPFSEISQIINMSKGFAYAFMEIGVDYGSDLDKVIAVLKRVSEELSRDPTFRPLMLSPMEVLGVEDYAASAITIRCRIKTVAGKQWDVKRGYLLRLKKAFDIEGIEIPYPHVVHIRKDAPES